MKRKNGALYTHAVRDGRSSAEAVQIVACAAVGLRSHGAERFDRRIGASQTEDLMSRVDEPLNDGDRS